MGCCGSKPEPEGFSGIKDEDRKCTDILCCLIFVICIVACVSCFRNGPGAQITLHVIAFALGISSVYRQSCILSLSRICTLALLLPVSISIFALVVPPALHSTNSQLIFAGAH